MAINYKLNLNLQFADPLVTVIVPIYNVEHYLRKCLESIINQTYKNLQILLINDGSTDACGLICEEYATKDIRVKVFHKKNGGQSSARNVGIQHADGKYISFVDSDDWIDIVFFEKLVKHAETNQLDICVCGRKEFQDGKLLQAIPVNDATDVFGDLPQYFSNYFFYPFTPVVWNKLYLRKLIIDNNVTFESVKYIETEDTLFNYTILLFANKVGSIDNVFYNHLIRKGSTALTYSVGALLRIDNLLDECLKSTKKINKNNSSNRAAIAYILNYFFNLHISKIKNNFAFNQKQAIENELILLKDGKMIRKFSLEILKNKKVIKILKANGYQNRGILLTKLLYFLLYMRRRKAAIELIHMMSKFK